MTIDTITRQVTNHGTIIDLTAREYSLLKYLAMRVDIVLARTDIWEHLYEFSSEASSSVVDIYKYR